MVTRKKDIERERTGFLQTRELILFLIVLLSIPAVMSQGAIVDQPGKWWAYSEGIEVDEEKMRQAPGFLEGVIRRENSCVFNGTEYYEGAVKDVGSPAYVLSDSGDSLVEKTFEEGGWYRDVEVCLNIPNSGDDVSGGVRSSDNYFGQDWGGEWYDLDQWKITKYLRENGDSVLVDEWKDYWHYNPDFSADPSTGVINSNSNGSSQGIALEDDCSQDLPCEDIGSGIGNQDPFYGNFTEGAFDDDHTEFRSNTLLETNLNNYHNRVQSGGNTGHEGSAPTTTSYDVDYSYEWNEGTYSNTKQEQGDLMLAKSSSTLSGIIYYGGDGHVGAYHPTDGLQWSTSANDVRTLKLGPNEDYLYTGDESGYVKKYNTANGNLVWSFSAHSSFIYDVELAGGNIFIATRGSGEVKRINQNSGSPSIAWTNSYHQDNFGSDAVHDIEILSNSLYSSSTQVGSDNNWGTYQFQQSDGSCAAPGCYIPYSLRQETFSNEWDGENIYVGMAEPDELRRVDYLADEIDWTTSMQNPWDLELSSDQSHIYAGTAGDTVYKVNTNDGGIDWSTSVASLPEALDIGPNGNIHVGLRGTSGTGEILELDSTDGSTLNSWQPAGENDFTALELGGGGTTFVNSGTYTSKSFGKSGEDSWSDIFVDYNLNGENADITVEYSSSSSFSSVSGSQTFNLDGSNTFSLSSTADYARFKVDLDSTSGANTPEINRVEITASSGSVTASDGGGNTQDQETDLTLSWKENSQINPKDDEWALTPRLNYGIANNGTPFGPWECHGAPRVQGEDNNKRDAVYANSFVNVSHVYSDGFSSIQYFRDTVGLPDSIARQIAGDGNWVNPDNEWRSAARGGFTCDLTGKDWGYGFANDSVDDLYCREGDCDKDGDPTNPGNSGFDEDNPHSVSAPIQNLNFDSENDPAGYPQNNQNQYPDACGDDQNEYLLREHAATIGGEDDPEFGGRSDYYACADRPTDCVYRGEVYSQGQLVDISDEGSGENGVNAYDTEICVDLDPNIPGGEWVDPDNESVRNVLIGTGTANNPEYYVRTEGPYESAPGNVTWHTTSTPAATEARDTPYNEVDYATGYALEDDCDKALEGVDSGCDDTGYSETLGTDNDWVWSPESDLVYSPFVEGMSEDDGNIFDGLAVRMWVGDGTGTSGDYAHGTNNQQDQENTAGVNFDSTRFGWPTQNLNDSEINSLEDTWAISNFSYHAVGPTGKIWANGSCYGTPADSLSSKATTKAYRVVGNSFAKAMDVDSDPEMEGVWVNPDTTNKTTLSGGTSCDLNLTDWGIGYNTGSGLLVTNNDSQPEYGTDDYHVTTGNITFDSQSDPNGVGASRNLPQYPNACGDDKNEFLIREHSDSIDNTEQQPNLGRENIYVCADRISDCAFHGEVYSEGQLVDIQSYGREEAGVNSVDEEVCVDADKSVPGGEWYDVDNESLNQILKGSSYDDSGGDNPSQYQGLVRLNSSYSGDGVKWFTDSYEPAREVEISPYHDLDYSDGYALEDDCADNVQYCADEGPTEQHFTEDAVYSYFEEGRKEDDSNVFDGHSTQMYVGYANGTASSDHGATNDQDEENTENTDFDSTEFGWPTPGLNDSTIDQLEDTWAISADLSDPVGPTGKVWSAGKCYGKNPWLNDNIQWIDKSYKVVANSYAMSVDVNGYPLDEEKGVWVNPDSTVESATTGHTFCDLNASDWGYGYNTGDGDNLQIINGSGNQPGDVRVNGYVEDSAHVVTGDIKFDINSDPMGKGASENLPQYPDACGDDKNEYLIREHRSLSDQSEHNATLEDDNIYVCADRITDCAYEGEVYSMGQTRDVSGTNEELGVNSDDAEICVDTNKNIPGGEWADPDNASIQEIIIGSGTEEQSSTYDGIVTFQNASGGVHWFNTSWGPGREYPIDEAYNSPYNDVDYKAGYAFEDDVGENVTWAEDSGVDETRKEGLGVYSHFIEGEKADDGNVGDGWVVRTYVNGSAKHGSYNTQQFENNDTPLGSLNDSRIDPNEDTWAIASEPYYAVGPTGKVYPNGSCYGPNNPNYKGRAVMANSYALAHDVDGDGQKEGDWVNPDNYEESVLNGLDSCEVKNLSDWGIGFDQGPGSELEWSQGAPRERGYNDTADWQFHIVSGPIQFDYESNPGSMDQDDLLQYPDNCGDDQNEHLIREHSSNATEDEHEPQLQRDTIYGCADRTTDCVYNGEVYSEGQLVQVSGADNESGMNSSDWDLCIDSDKRIPGGEWHDVDNTTWRNYLTGANDPDWDYQEDNVSSYKRLVEHQLGNEWFTDNVSAAREVESSPFHPLNYSDGYALEDDVDPDLAYTADIGNENQFKPGYAVYSAFIEDVGEDDNNIFQGKAVRMYVGYANGTASAAHGATNQQSEENAGNLNFSINKWGYTIALNDSTINFREDTWALADNTSDVVGPTGSLYDAGQCYGSNTSTIMEDSIRKNDTVMANSYAMAVEVNGDGNKEGVWVNPDSTEKSLTAGNFSCELNSTDWGIGYNTGIEGRNSHGDATLDVHHGDARSPGYEVDDIHAVSGPITFDYQSDPPGVVQDNKPQYPSACGDDQGEFLIREHRTPNGNEYKVNLNRDNIYVCADRQSDCAYNGYVFSEGDTIDISSLAAPGEDPERGDDIGDEEICLDLDKSLPGGEWYDKDNNFTVQSRVEEISENSQIEEGPDGSGTVYDLSGKVTNNAVQGEVHIKGSSTTINSDDSFSFTAGLAAGTTQVIEYRENGDVQVSKRIALPQNSADIENIRLNVNAAFDPDAAWAGIEANRDHDFGYNPGTDWRNQTHKLEKEELGFFNRSGSYSAVYPTYAPEGYATEDDCGKLLQKDGTGPCGDVGDETQNKSWFNAGNFSFNEPTAREGALQDNYDTTNYDYYGIHNRIDDSSNQFQATSEPEPGTETEGPAETMRNWNLSDVYGPGYKVYESEDSTEGPDEWALTRYLNYSVDNRGNGYPPGTADRTGCYYREGVSPRTDILDEGVTKKEKVFGNSFANASDYDNDGIVEGVWEDPDELPSSFANFSCDITGPDKGYGHDTGDNNGSFQYKNNEKSTHTVIGDIAFAVTDGKTGAFAQEPPVCGDDHKEYLIEELGAAHNSLEDTGRWGCGTDYDDCVSREGGEYALYRKGDIVNTGEAAEDFGRVKRDKEICQQRTADQYGVWYDQDYRKEFCQANNLYGSIGVRWINESYINQHPYAVAEGINDDLNPYLEKNSAEPTVESTQGDAQKYIDNGELDGQTPVPTGKFVENRSVDQYYTNYASWSRPSEYLNLSATKGFCGGDDQGENVIVQQSSTELLETNYSVIAIADSEDDCVLDGANYDSIDSDKRKIYSTGENVTMDLGPSERTAACYGGRWYAEWPVVFLQDNVEVEQGTERDITFRVINVESERRNFDIELEADPEIERFTAFNSFNGSEFRASIPAESSRQYTVEVYGQDSNIGPSNISVRASAVTGTITGEDSVVADIVSTESAAEGTAQTSEVPGMGMIHLLLLMLASMMVYYRQL